MATKSRRCRSGDEWACKLSRLKPERAEVYQHAVVDFHGGEIVDCLRYVYILKRGHGFQLYHDAVNEHVNDVISKDIAVFIAHLDWHLCLDIETCF